VLQIRDRCTATVDSIPELYCSTQRGKGLDMWHRGESPQREQLLCAFAEISLKEQGEIKALQEKRRVAREWGVV